MKEKYTLISWLALVFGLFSFYYPFAAILLPLIFGSSMGLYFPLPVFLIASLIGMFFSITGLIKSTERKGICVLSLFLSISVITPFIFPFILY